LDALSGKMFRRFELPWQVIDEEQAARDAIEPE
jgi:hypothetical protein